MGYGLIQKVSTLETEILVGRNVSDAFGNAVYVYEDTMVVGAYLQSYDSNEENVLSTSGAAYVFTRSGTAWLCQQKLVGSGVNGRIAGDQFGYSVGVYSNTVVVGAPKQSYDVTGSNSLTEAGACYVFTRNGTVWSQQQKIVGTGTNGRIASDQFGVSVGIWSEAVIVGAWYHDYDSSGANSLNLAGAAYLFTRSGTAWSLQQKIVGSGANGRNASDYLGYSAGIYSETVVLGSFYHGYDGSGANSLIGSGACYVFTRSGTVWSLQQKLVGTGTNGRITYDHFGYSLGIYSDTIVVGANQQDYDSSGANSINSAGACYVFTRSGTAWSLQQKIVGTGTNGRNVSDQFGCCLGIYSETVVVGAYYHSYDGSGANSLYLAGAGYVFTRSGTAWGQQQKLVGTGTNGRMSYDYFGFSVGIYSETVIAGAYQQDYDVLGANSLTSAGAGYVFTRSGTAWSQQQKTVQGLVYQRPPDEFGAQISVHGNTAIISAPQNEGIGVAYIYTKSGGIWSQQQKLLASGTNSRNLGDYFYAVKVYSETAIVGAYKHDYDASGANSIENAGACYVFTRSGTVWSQQQKLVGTGTNGRVVSSSPSDYTGDRFGWGLDISGDMIVVGAMGQSYDVSGANSLYEAGAAFVFTRSGTVWSLQQKIVASGTNGRSASSNFGISISIYGDTLVVGANNDPFDASGSNSISQAGAAYIFTRSGTTWVQQQKLVASGVNGRELGGGGSFGYSLHLENDTVAIDALTQSYDASGLNYVAYAGAVYVFTRSGTVWAQQQKLVGTSRSQWDTLGGMSISLHGDKLLLSSYNSYDENGTNSLNYAGAAYLFTRSGTSWSIQQKIVGTGTNGRNVSDAFSWGNAIVDDNELLLGACKHGYDSSGSDFGKNAGAVFVYRSAYYWLGTNSNWNDTSNWSLTSGGTGGASVPTSADIAVFDGTGVQCTLTGNISIASLLVSDSTMDTNGYRINCGDMVLGVGGKVYFRNCSHYIGSISCTGGEIDWGTGRIGVTGNLDLRNISATNIGVYKSGFAHIELSGVVNQDVYAGGQILPILEVIKPSGTVTFRDDIACRQLNNLEGTIVGTTIYDIFDSMIGVYPYSG